jgi:hypothetical protein
VQTPVVSFKKEKKKKVLNIYVDKPFHIFFIISLGEIARKRCWSDNINVFDVC